MVAVRARRARAAGRAPACIRGGCGHASRGRPGAGPRVRAGRAARTCRPCRAQARDPRSPTARRRSGQQRAAIPTCVPKTSPSIAGSGNWGISYLSGSDLLADVTVDGRTGEVVEAWQGTQAGWLMARGHDGYFGETFDDWYVWIPLCLLFVAPFFDPRRPFRMLHVDLLVLLGRLRRVPLLLQQGRDRDVGAARLSGARLLSRAHAGVRRFARAAPVSRSCPSCRPRSSWPASCCSAASASASTSWRARWATSATAARSAPPGSRTDQPLYVDSGKDDQHFDTYGPVNYLAYDPFVRIWKPSQSEIDTSGRLRAARPRARPTLVFDALTVLGLFLLGMRLRRGREGRLLGLGARIRLGELPVHAVPADDEQQRHADLDAASCMRCWRCRRRPPAVR